MSNPTSGVHKPTQHPLNVMNIALVVLAVIVGIILVLDLMMLTPVTNTAAPTATSMPMSEPTSEY